MVLATCQASETIGNLRKLFTLLRLDTIEDFFIAGDLKVINLLSGIGTQSSSFPCAYCKAKSSHWSIHAPLRTIEGNEQDFRAWEGSGGRACDRKEFFSCSALPILRAEGPVLFICPPPPLHLKLGIVNQLMNLIFSHCPEVEEHLQ